MKRWTILSLTVFFSLTVVHGQPTPTTRIRFKLFDEKRIEVTDTSEFFIGIKYQGTSYLQWQTTRYLKDEKRWYTEACSNYDFTSLIIVYKPRKDTMAIIFFSEDGLFFMDSIFFKPIIYSTAKKKIEFTNPIPRVEYQLILQKQTTMKPSYNIQAKRDTIYIAFDGDSVVQKGDTTYIFKPNGCLEEKGTWDFKKQRWIGKYILYYTNDSNSCGQIRFEILYDNNGKYIWRKDGNGRLIEE